MATKLRLGGRAEYKVRAKEADAVRRRKPVRPWAQSLAATCMGNSGRVAPRNRLRRLRLLRVASLRSASTAPRPALGLPGRSARCARSTCSRRRAWPRFAALAVARQSECLALSTCKRTCFHAAGRRRSFIPPVSAEPCGPADREEGSASRLSGRLSSQCRARSSGGRGLAKTGLSEIAEAICASLRSSAPCGAKRLQRPCGCRASAGRRTTARPVTAGPQQQRAPASFANGFGVVPQDAS